MFDVWMGSSTALRVVWAFVFCLAMVSAEVAAEDDVPRDWCGDRAVEQTDGSELLREAREATQEQRWEEAATAYECYVFTFDEYDADVWTELAEVRLALGAEHAASRAFATACELDSQRACRNSNAGKGENLRADVWFRWRNVSTIAGAMDGRRANVAVGTKWSPRTSVAMTIGQADRRPSSDAEAVHDWMLGVETRWEHPEGPRLGGGGARGLSVDFSPRWRLYGEAGWKWKDIGVTAETRIGRLEYTEIGTTIVSPSAIFSRGSLSVSGRYALGVDDDARASHAWQGQVHFRYDMKTAFELGADAGDRPDLLTIRRLIDTPPASYYRMGVGGSRLMGSLIDLNINLNYRRQREIAVGPGVHGLDDDHILELGLGMNYPGR